MNLWRKKRGDQTPGIQQAPGTWIATELMGVRGVRLYHDQPLFKEPGGGTAPGADQ